MRRGDVYFSVKQYDTLSTAEKVRHIHALLEDIQFPHIIPISKEKDSNIIVQPWLVNTVFVQYASSRDRTDSLRALQALHETKERIDWSEQSIIPSFHIQQKWTHRLERFIRAKQQLEPFLPESSIEHIIFMAKQGLENIAISNDRETLLHGDVVHHNILRDRHDQIRFIDFDLAVVGNPVIEIALWIHRVLPQMDYDLEKLITEQPGLQQNERELFSLLLYPNELLREWLHFLTLSQNKQQQSLERILRFTNHATSYSSKLWYDIKRMMN